ncbi:MAG TPA: MBL fold metallo-hydrolase [Chitinophagaceae bacterium]|nr:MBL fold metallo-hydrolase [Chitinophagaceae bacterium]
MHRLEFLRSSFLAAGALALSRQKWLGFPGTDPWKITMLRNNVGIFTEKGGTIAFHLAPKGIVVVDAEFPEQSQHLINELRNRSDQPFRLLINTHHHGDHTAGNISFKGIVEQVLAHENSRTNQQNVAAAQKTEDQQLFPNQTFTQTWCTKNGKESICLYYYGPGHTNGDALIHFEHANIVHMGDLVFNRRHPFVDRSAGANMKNWIRVLDQAVQKFDRKTLFVFGHAADDYPVTGSADDLKAFGEYLGRILDFTASQIKAGKSKEEVLKITTLPFETQWKGDGLERPLQAAYEELTAG